eukprot:Transcript_6285.p1 GENE.Transcript_6285~~Transcript_6285.p1  ORF type:complete len:576 (+),score=110.13 Transcript_6285:56-1783(+)
MVPVACLLTLASVASDGSSELSSHMVHSSAYRCCVGQTIRVQVSDKTVPGQYDVTFNADTGSFEFSGYLPRILNLIEMETGLRIELTPVNVAQGLVNSYKMIADGDFDIGFSLPTWYAYSPDFQDLVAGMYATPELLGMIGMNESHVQRLSRDDFAFTAPWHNGKWVGYIFKTRNSGGLWRFAAPFSPNMWAALVGSIFVFAFLFGSLRVIRTSWDPAANAESGPLGKGAIYGTIDAIYDAWVTVLGGDEREAVTWPERLVRVAFLFFVLITTSTYTANLAAFFTQTSFTLHGPQSMAELKTANACLLFKEGMAGVSPYTGSVFAAFGMMEMVGENPDVSFLEIERSAYQTCMQRLRDGASDVIIMERTIAARILAQVQEAPLGGRRRLRAAAKSGALLPGAGAGDSGATEGQGACDELSFVSDIQFGTGDTYVLPLHRTTNALRMRIDEALHFIHNQPNLGLAVQEEIFRLSASTCPTADARSETQVELSSQGGVFIIVGILILIAVTLEVGTALKNRKAVARAAQGGVGVEMEGEHAGDRERSDRELLLTVLQLLEHQAEAQKPPASQAELKI